MLSDVDQQWLDLLGVDPTRESAVPCPVLRLDAISADKTVVDVPRHLVTPSSTSSDDLVPLPRRVRPRLNEITSARWIGWPRISWPRINWTWLGQRTRVLQLTALALAAVVVSLLGIIVLR
jgi:hypothetical protein